MSDLKDFFSVNPKKRNAFIWAAVILISAVLILTVIDFLFYSTKKFDRLSNWIDPAKYQAVFLSNGQVYFGKVADVTSDTLLMDDIYYLKAAQGLQSSGAYSAADGSGTADNAADAGIDSQDFSLVKLGNEIHGPEDNMSVNLQHVLFVENLKPDSKVVQAIGQYETNK